MYLEITSLKSVSSLKLHRYIAVSQPTAWFMLDHVREGWNRSKNRDQFSGPVVLENT